MRLDRGLLRLVDSDYGRGESVSGHAVPYGLEATSLTTLRPTRPQILGKIAGVLVALGLMALSLVTIGRTLSAVDWSDVWIALTAMPTAQMLASLLFVALSYLALTGYDFLGLNYLGKSLPYRRVVLGSFLSYGFANNLGFPLLIGGSVRYRIYAPLGLRTADIALLTVICGLTFALSGVLVAALCLVLEPTSLGRLIGLPSGLAFLLGLVLMSGLVGYVGWVGTERRSLKWGLRELPLPGARSTVAQLAIGLADMTFGAAALYLLLPASTDIDFLIFIGVFAIAMTLGLLSHVPGGIGVFETVMLIVIPGATTTEILASLLVFRCVYYLLPLLAAVALFIRHEAARLPSLARLRVWGARAAAGAAMALWLAVELLVQLASMLVGLVRRRFFATAGRA